MSVYICECVSLCSNALFHSSVLVFMHICVAVCLWPLFGVYICPRVGPSLPVCRSTSVCVSVEAPDRMWSFRNKKYQKEQRTRCALFLKVLEVMEEDRSTAPRGVDGEEAAGMGPVNMNRLWASPRARL